MASIGLVDVDGHNFPNLALMKLSAWHKSRGDAVEFAGMFGRYDLVYKSKVFTWTADDEYAYPTDHYIDGGTGYDLKITLPEEVESMCPDYTIYACEHAYGFLTRGCPNKCPWCFVPEKEGDIRANADIDDFLGGMDSAVLMDNNVLAHPHGIAQMVKIAKRGIRVDFNQGIDARLIDKSVANLMASMKWIRCIRLACDSQAMKKHVENAVNYLRRAEYHGEIFVYVLCQGIDDALDRVEFLRGLGCDPFAQAYRDKIGTPPTQEQKRFCRWVNHKAIFKSVAWGEYV
jgi:hypothetical protein